MTESKYARSDGASLSMWCPGCDDLHRVTIGTPDSWSWDGNIDKPTVSPSIKVGGVQWAKDAGFYKPNHAKVAAGQPIICHSFLRNGIWEFLSDSTHVYAGQHIAMVPFPSEHLFGVSND